MVERSERYNADFGKTAEDYAAHRAGFPDRFFDALAEQGIGQIGQSILDLGTGTGTLARGLAARGALVTGLDISQDMLDQATILAEREGFSGLTFMRGSATATGLPEAHFDVVMAGQCWHWFDSPEAFQEVYRVLKPGGCLCICHFDWLPLTDNVVEATEALILEYSPSWPFGGGTGLYPQWMTGMANNGFQEVSSFSFDHLQTYSHAAWRGRIRASAPISGTLSKSVVAEFDQALTGLLASTFPEDPLTIPHRCWATLAFKPV